LRFQTQRIGLTMRQPIIGHHRAQMFALSPEGVLMVSFLPN
jgi:hypothetical protein